MTTVLGIERHASTGRLIRDAGQQLSALLSAEAARVRAEVAARLRLMRVAVVVLALALAAFTIGLNIAASALVVALSLTGLGPIWAPVLVGGILVATALALGYWAVSALGPSALLPLDMLDRLRGDTPNSQEFSPNDPSL